MLHILQLARASRELNYKPGYYLQLFSIPVRMFSGDSAGFFFLLFYASEKPTVEREGCTHSPGLTPRTANPRAWI